MNSLSGQLFFSQCAALLVLMQLICAVHALQAKRLQLVIISSGIMLGFVGGVFLAPFVTPAADAKNMLTTGIIIGLGLSSAFVSLTWRALPRK